MKRAMLIATLMTLCTNVAFSQEIRRTPLRADHPLVGAWKIELPEFACYEVYNLRANGTKRTISGREVSESVFRISDYPSARGFYKWIDKIVKHNGQADCTGDKSPIGDIAINYILLHPDGTQFLLCSEENLHECVGPFIRQESI
ncbi:hypothetical protein H8K32_11720 [Undibacterium jejuense]|uniref:Lipocalin-like domain-containing protein n=1 Tax=Undibacterium jejuense TaxID=1344949 RepID=A0A923HJB3_9BURK|nr:hypothetical protein [Undibacterium jejuense]MBC3862772.1 hypothetical protein [Undibacterium jejuense]